MSENKNSIQHLIDSGEIYFSGGYPFKDEPSATLVLCGLEVDINSEYGGIFRNVWYFSD